MSDHPFTTSFPGFLSSASLGHVPTCDTKFSTGVGSTNNFCRSQLKRKKGDRWPSLCLKPPHGQIHLWNSPVLFWASHRSNETYLYLSSVFKYHSDFNSSRWIYWEVRLFCCFMLPELNSWHIIRYIKRCFIYHFAKYNSWLPKNRV